MSRRLRFDDVRDILFGLVTVVIAMLCFALVVLVLASRVLPVG